MEKNKKIELDAPDLLVKYRKPVDRAIRNGVREALRKHRQAGNPVAIWRNGKVVLLQPEEINLEHF